MLHSPLKAKAPRGRESWLSSFLCLSCSQELSSSVLTGDVSDLSLSNTPCSAASHVSHVLHSSHGRCRRCSPSPRAQIPPTHNVGQEDGYIMPSMDLGQKPLETLPRGRARQRVCPQHRAPPALAKSWFRYNTRNLPNRTGINSSTHY